MATGMTRMARVARPVLAAAGIALGALAGGGGAAAGQITNLSIVTPAPNNDDVAGTANANLVEVTGFVGSLAPGDLVFVVRNSGGTTEYRLSAILNNDTGTSWSGFRLELGFGTGAGFVPVGPLGVVDFDLPERDPGPTGGAFPVLDHGAGSLTWSGGIVPPIVDNPFTFSIDVGDLVAAAGMAPEGGYEFTLRQTPVAAISAPLPLVLLGAGLAGWGGLAWRRGPERRRRERAEGGGVDTVGGGDYPSGGIWMI